MRRQVNPVDGRKIADLRDRAGYTSSQFAAKAGISIAHMNRIEKNERSPSPAIRNKILAALGVTLEDIAPDPEPALVA